MEDASINIINYCTRVQWVANLYFGHELKVFNSLL